MDIVCLLFDGITALASATAQPYDVVVCDIGLPGMDGYALVEKIRTTTQWSIPTFVATSGYNEAYGADRARQIGFDHYLIKPLAIAELLALMDRHAPTMHPHQDLFSND